MSQPVPHADGPEPEAAPAASDVAPPDRGSTDEPAPMNRAERRARSKAAASGRTGPPPERTLRRGRGPRSHTKRI